MTLIKELQSRVSNDNIYFIEELADIIIEEKIQTLEELKMYESNYNNNLSIEEVIINRIKEIDNNPFEYDGLLHSQIGILKEERKLIESGNLENKIMHLIKYYSLTKRYNPFPYLTYQFIMQGKL